MSDIKTKLPSIILLVLGAALVIWGYQLSGGAANEVAKSLTGSATDAVMYRYIIGAVCLAAGAYLFFKKR